MTLSFQESAAEECQTEGILQSQANIVANAYRKRADEIQTERIEGWQNFRRETDPLVASCCLPMLQHEADFLQIHTQGKLDLESGIAIYSALVRADLTFLYFPRCWLVCCPNVNY